MIVFSKRVVQELEDHAKKEAPKEACGVLAGTKNREKIVKKVYECTNVDAMPETNYTIDAKELLRVIEEIEDSDFELLGFYHSHPMSLVHPSSIDVGRATWTGYSYVIVSLLNRTKISSWVWSEEERRFIEEGVKIRE
jgi:proteasome lid subunit RPN8/RPN11